MENNKDYIDEKDKKEEHDLNETNSIESNSLDNTSSVNITNEKEGMELIESNIPEVKKLDIEEVNLCKCQCSHNKEQEIETTLAVDSKEDSYEEEEIQNNIKTMDENKNKKNITNFIIILCFLAVISFFISREFINTSKEEQSSAIINQVDSITRDVVEIREVERGKVMNAKEIFANSVDSVVGIQTETNQNVFGQIVNSATSGTGFIISKDGYIVTNYHVIENAHKITVNLYDGKEYDARLVGTEEESDLAVLKIDSEDLKPVVIGDSDSIIVGEDIYTIGHP